MKWTSIDQLTDEIIGKEGTPERDAFEYDLQMDSIGAMIKDARKKKKMTQRDLGKLLGVQRSQISKLENNTKDFRIGTILKALDALGAKVKLSVEFQQDEQIVAP
ncbi:MAG: helix-turn-helix domain-containing protein [Bacteroidetes bacterium]|jgi:DNA-binding XRE family transcriptional regulator|nr:helix-turn-helix domain-containing protein [Bacteroidota bacterium]